MVKKIHYCWFGGKELPASVKKCINTWKKIMPDYEIIEWNEKNFDINSSNFVKEAYENKKWAFVSDYVRIYALYQEGGIYFDTDMKVIKDVSDIVDKDMFLGYEDSGYVGTAVIGVKERHNKYIKEILDYYNDIDHFNPEIIYNYANPVIITKIIKKYNSYVDEKGIKIFDNNIYVYPRDYFYPLSYNYEEKIYTENTCMIHLFNATWTDKGERRVIGIYRKFGPELGKIINSSIDKLFRLRDNIRTSIKRIYNFMKFKYSVHINITRRIKKAEKVLAEKKDNYIVICHPEMTEKNEQIKNMFNDNILEIREMHTKKEAKRLAQTIEKSGKNKIIFNSFEAGWDNIMSSLRYLKRDITIKVMVHGGAAIFSEGNNWDSLNTIIDLYNKGYVNEIGFFNKSLYEFYKAKDYNVKYLMKYIEINNVKKYKKEAIEKGINDKIKIGMYEAYDATLKNSYNQISAVSLLENAVLDYSPINYKVAMMARKYNINLTGTSNYITKEEIYNKIANNDINLFVSLGYKSDLLPIESLELGTICLIGNNYEYFEDNEIEKYIVVSKEDNIKQIYNKINFALENKEKILDLYKKWKENYIIQAKESIQKFI